MAKQIDLTGQRFGHLVVLEYAGADNGALWKCKCDCGNTVITKGTKLRSGGKKSCGCKSHPDIIDLTGQRFGKLVVIGLANKKNKTGLYWMCQCDCGKKSCSFQRKSEKWMHEELRMY